MIFNTSEPLYLIKDGVFFCSIINDFHLSAGMSSDNSFPTTPNVGESLYFNRFDPIYLHFLSPFLVL